MPLSAKVLLRQSIIAIMLCWTSASFGTEAHPDWVNALKPKGESGPELTLAADGKTEYVILVPAAPTPLDEKAAEELALHLKTMTGATFAVVREGDGEHGKAISVGRTQRMRDADLPQARADLGNEGIAIAVKGDDLFLFGGDLRGPVYAVGVLLEEDLGCRWYTHERAVIPHRPTLVFRPVPRVYVPPLELRDPFFTVAFQGEWPLHNRTVSRHFGLKRSLGGYPKPVPNNAHTYFTFVPPDKYFKDHPEYFSMDDKGERNQRQLCLTNPDVLDIVVREGLRMLAEDPEARVLEVSPMDRTGWCMCPECRAVDESQATDIDYGYSYPNHTGTLVSFVNKVADRIKDKHPDVVVSTLAYLGTLRPPKDLRPRPNVRIWLCTTMHWGTPFRFITESNNQTKVIEGWNKVGAQLLIWHYPNRFGPGLAELHLIMQVIGHDIRYLVNNGAKGIFLQGLENWTNGYDREFLRAWVWAKQLWNPDLSTRALIRDFNYGFYGPAAEAIQAHDDLLWETWERLHMHPAYQHSADPTAVYDPVFLDEAMSHLDRAEALVGDDASLRTWVRLRKLPLWIAKGKMGPVNGIPAYATIVDEVDQFIHKEYGVPQFDHIARAAVEDVRLWRKLAIFDPADIAFVDTGIEPNTGWRYKRGPIDPGDDEKSLSGWRILPQDSKDRVDPQGLANVTGVIWFRNWLNVPEDFDSRKHLWLVVNAERLNPDTEISVYLDGKLVHEQTAEAKKRPLLPMDFPFNVDVKKPVKPGGTHHITLKVRYLRPHVGRTFRPVSLLSTNLDPAGGAREGGLIAFEGAMAAQRRLQR